MTSIAPRRVKELKAEVASLKAEVADEKFTVKQQHKKIVKLRTDNAKLRGLLSVAKCPNCDGSGGIRDSVTGCLAEQCEWCAVREQALKEETL